MSSVNIDPQLYEVIKDDFEKLKGNDLGSNEREAALDEITKLLEKDIEIKKVNIDCEMRKQQIEDEKKDRLIKNLISVAGIVLPIGLTIWGTKVSLKFEEEGTITTIMGRGFINKLLPKK